MILLPNGCYCTGQAADAKKGTPDTLPILPADWSAQKLSPKKEKELLAKTWCVRYRFYDPKIVDEKGRVKPKQVVIKEHINAAKTLAERRLAVAHVMRTELSSLKDNGWNPITQKSSPPSQTGEFDISPFTPFCRALEKAVDLLIVKRETRQDAKSVVKYVTKALERLHYDYMPIGEVEPKHLNVLFLFLKKEGGSTFTKAKWNRYRANLVMLFKRLKKVGAVKANYAEDIDRLKKVKKIRETLSKEQASWVNDFLLQHNPVFHRFVHIFFHSGARETELMNLKGKNVTLKAQTYRCTVMKGAEPFEVDRTIKDIALPFWEEAMSGCGAEDYVFSKGLVPGSEQISSTQITRRWKRWIKERLNKQLRKEGKPEITADFYSLKHLNTTTSIDYLEEQEREAERLAAEQNAHKDTAMVVSIYDTKQRQRKHEKQKKVANKLA